MPEQHFHAPLARIHHVSMVAGERLPIRCRIDGGEWIEFSLTWTGQEMLISNEIGVSYRIDQIKEIFRQDGAK